MALRDPEALSSATAKATLNPILTCETTKTSRYRQSSSPTNPTRNPTRNNEYRTAIDDYLEPKSTPTCQTPGSTTTKPKSATKSRSHATYTYTPPRPLTEIDAEIKALEAEIQALLDEVESEHAAAASFERSTNEAAPLRRHLEMVVLVQADLNLRLESGRRRAARRVRLGASIE